MSKTPVSTLQEYSAKQMWGMPDYTLICKNTDTQPQRFTYQVTCRSLSACGTASSKKEAKHLAAKELLKLLSQAESSVQAQRASSIVIPTIDSYYLPDYDNVSHDNVFINSVGKLSEYCASQKFKIPEYRDTGMSGPPHAPLFTVFCTIGNLEVNAAANSKKKAKHDAAQAMLDKLVRNTNYRTSHAIASDSFNYIEDKIRNIDTLDLKIEQPTITTVESSARAKELFPKLKRYMGTKKTTCNVSVKDYHRIFKNSYDPIIREAVCVHLNDTSYAQTTKQEVLNNVTSLLGLSIEYETLLTERNDIIILVGKLNSTPIITDTGVGETYLDARDQLIENLLKSIDIFLR